MGKKEIRSNKWSFLMYEESAPEDYLEVLESLHVPFILSPWHNKDINSTTGEIKKSHKHGALWFETLKSYSQVSELISESINGPKHIEVVMSPKGLYDYFTHAQNPNKTAYDISDIESGSGFDLSSFLIEQSSSEYINRVIDIIESQGITEFEELVSYTRQNEAMLLPLIVNKTYFFAKMIDSKRYQEQKRQHSMT